MAEGEIPNGSGSDLVGKIGEQPAVGGADPALSVAHKLAPSPTDASSLLNTTSETAVKLDFVPTDGSGIVAESRDLTADSNKLDPQVPTDATSLASKVSTPSDTALGETSDFIRKNGSMPTDPSTLAGMNGSFEAAGSAIKMSPIPTDASGLTGKVSFPGFDGVPDTVLNAGPNADPVPDAAFHASTESLLQSDPLVQATALGALGAGGGTDDPVIDPNNPFPLGSPLGQHQPTVIDPNNPFPFGSQLGQPVDPTFDPNRAMPIDAPGSSSNPYSPGFLVASEVNPHPGLPGPAPTPTDVSGLAGNVGGSGPTDPGVIRADGPSALPPLTPPQTFAQGSVRGATGAAHIHGYIAFVDPSTNAEYLPHQANGLGTSIAPGAIRLRFQHITGATMSVDVGGGQYWYREAVREVDGSIATRAANSGGIAWYYDIQLNLDDSDGDPRVDLTFDAAAGPALAAVVYNPQRWQFLDAVSVGFAVGVGTGAGQLFTRRATPFSDLPDPR